MRIGIHTQRGFGRSFTPTAHQFPAAHTTSLGFFQGLSQLTMSSGEETADESEEDVFRGRYLYPECRYDNFTELYDIYRYEERLIHTSLRLPDRTEIAFVLSQRRLPYEIACSIADRVYEPYAVPLTPSLRELRLQRLDAWYADERTK